MNKKPLLLAVVGALITAGSAFAEMDMSAPSISGFADVQLNLTNEADEDSEGQFAVPQVEVVVETDNLYVAIAGSDEDAFEVGQAYFMHNLNDSWQLRGGLFDSNLTADAGAAVDMEFTQNSLLFSQVLAGVGGEVLKGLAVTGMVGPANVMVAYANDTSIATGEGKNSIAVLVNGSPMEGLDLELGLLTQEDDPATTTPGAVGNLVDINGTYMINGFTVGLDYLMGGDPEDGEFDSGYSFWGGYDFGNGFNVKARFESLSPEGDGDDLEATELYASYALSENLLVALDLHNLDDGTTDFDTNSIEFVATF